MKTPNSKSGQSKFRLIGVILLATVVVSLLVAFDGVGWLKDVLDRLSGSGLIGMVGFVVVYVLATLLFLPGLILTTGAGASFGVLTGSVLVSVASTIGASLAFFIGRYLARDWVEGRIADNRLFETVDDTIGAEGWKVVGLLRLAPTIPFNLLNYALGVTRVKFSHYLVASWLGMMPGTVLYVYIGSIIGAAVGEDRARTPMEWALYGLGLVSTVVVTVLVARKARRALRDRVDAR